MTLRLKEFLFFLISFPFLFCVIDQFAEVSGEI